MQEGNCQEGKMSRLGWRNLVKAFKERTGWNHDKNQLLARYRQLKIFHTCLIELKSSTGGARAGGGYKARKDVWDHYTKVSILAQYLNFLCLKSLVLHVMPLKLIGVYITSTEAEGGGALEVRGAKLGFFAARHVQGRCH